MIINKHMIPHVTHYTKPSVCNMEFKHMSSLTKKPTQPWPQQYTPAPAQDYSAVGREEPRTPHTQTARTKKGRKLSLQNGTSKPAEQASPKHCFPIPTPLPHLPDLHMLKFGSPWPIPKAAWGLMPSWTSLSGYVSLTGWDVALCPT